MWCKSLPLCLGVISLGLSACQKAPTEPPPAPEPTAAPTATPTPAPTPTPTPQARLAPVGTYYVVKSFSATTEDGIFGFPVGTKVTLVHDQGAQWVVTDGAAQATAPKDAFTNDLDVAESMVKKVRSVALQIEARQEAARKAAEEAHAKLYASSPPTPPNASPVVAVQPAPGVLPVPSVAPVNRAVPSVPVANATPVSSIVGTNLIQATKPETGPVNSIVWRTDAAGAKYRMGMYGNRIYQ